MGGPSEEVTTPSPRGLRRVPHAQGGWVGPVAAPTAHTGPPNTARRGHSVAIVHPPLPSPSTSPTRACGRTQVNPKCRGAGQNKMSGILPPRVCSPHQNFYHPPSLLFTFSLPSN